MMVCVHAGVLGTKRHLVFDTGKNDWSWVLSIPDKCWVYGGGDAVKSVNECIKLHDYNVASIFPPTYKKCFKTLGLENDVNVPWHMVLPHDYFQQAIDKLVKEIIEQVTILESDSYCQYFLKEREFLSRLLPAYIDVKKMKTYLIQEKNPTVSKALKSFQPNKEGYANAIKYDQTSTRTGRLTIKRGPQILTLTRKYRDILKSRYEGGTICQVDFVSLEPRVARILSGYPLNKDIYEDIAHGLFKGELKRPQVKLAVLCALYGMSVARLEKMLKGGFGAGEVIRRIKDYFGVPTLLGQLRAQIRNKGYIQNYFGRQLRIEKGTQNILISHFLQSTACDAALLGFSSLVNEWEKSKVQFSPLYVIHDALLIDVHPASLNLLIKSLNDGAEVGELGNFPVAFSIVGNKEGGK